MNVKALQKALEGERRLSQAIELQRRQLDHLRAILHRLDWPRCAACQRANEGPTEGCRECSGTGFVAEESLESTDSWTISELVATDSLAARTTVTVRSHRSAGTRAGGMA